MFPMERLFETYLASILTESLAANAKLYLQYSQASLCQHLGNPAFLLVPDFVIEHDGHRWILDAKWKQVEETSRQKNYKLAQSDFYQMYAYAQKYLSEQSKGEVALIFPRWNGFNQPLPPFCFSDNLTLRAFPLDLETDEIIGLAEMGFPVKP